MTITKAKLIVFLTMYFIVTDLFAQTNINQLPDVDCTTNMEKQNKRSAELQALVNADQQERADWQHMSNEEKIKLVKNDLKRRKRVGVIFGEGCFKSADDYSAASLIYQHGNVPDHYYQAFIWANRAVELGDIKQKNLVAMTIDKYLVSIGKKQLFGSQFSLPDDLKQCFCLQPVEDSFPDYLRQEYTGHTLLGSYDTLAVLNQGNSCPNTECSLPLKPSPKGTVPGLW